MTTPISNRHDFVLLFDVTDGNPNGDPDAGNMPRVDPETGHGLVTDVCLKRKVRNYVGLKKDNKPPFEIYVKEEAILNAQNERAYIALEISPKVNGKRRARGPEVDKARDWMCKNFYDVRTFGAVMSTGINAGQVRGPVQLTFSRSVVPVISLEHTITRMAATDEKEAAKIEKEGQRELGEARTMGQKSTISYGLYRAHGFVSPHLAGGEKGTGFTEEDLALFWEALGIMFDHDRSAARGLMATQRLIVFRHDSKLGNAPAHKLFERVTVKQKEGIDTPRSFGDFNVTLDDTELPAGITVSTMV